MLIYLFVILIIFIVYQNRGNKRTISYLLFFVILFLCGGYMCGSDWRQYEQLFYNVTTIKTIRQEPGIYILMIAFRKIWDNYWFFSIIIKAACFWGIWTIIKKYAKEHALLALLFFISFYGIYLFIDAPLRNLLAIGVFMSSIIMLEHNKYLSYALCLSACIFHASAIICFPLIFLFDKKIPSWIFLITYLFSLTMSFLPELLSTIVVDSIIGDFLFLGDKVEHYWINGFSGRSMKSSAYSMGEILKIILFFFAFFNETKIKSLNHGTTIFNECMFFFIIAKFGAAINVLMRLGCFLSPFYAIAIAVIINFYKHDRLSYSLGVLLLSLLITFKTVTADYRFVPYTNYITYNIVHLGKNPSFYERSRYNFIYSPYKNAPKDKD